jgi:hypothetical protein
MSVKYDEIRKNRWYQQVTNGNYLGNTPYPLKKDYLIGTFFEKFRKI